MRRTRSAWLAGLALFVLAIIALHLAQPERATAAVVAAAPVDPSTLTLQELCDAYRVDRDARIYAELAKRPLLPASDFQHAITGQVFVGMSHTGLLCARGYPDRVRSDHTSAGTTHWMYWNAPALMVQERDDQVVAFSD